MTNLFIKVITGFREDQQFSIPAEEAHKAYYLFLHPDERGVFDNGVALRGVDIKQIEPDYNATMGWNPGYKMDEYDWSEVRGKGIARKLQDVLVEAKKLSQLPNPPVSLKLSEARQLYLTHEGAVA